MNELILSITIEPLEEGGYLATSDDLQGLIAQGRTIAETIEIAQECSAQTDRIVRCTWRPFTSEDRRSRRATAETNQDQDSHRYRFEPAPA